DFAGWRNQKNRVDVVSTFNVDDVHVVLPLSRHTTQPPSFTDGGWVSLKVMLHPCRVPRLSRFPYSLIQMRGLDFRRSLSASAVYDPTAKDPVCRVAEQTLVDLVERVIQWLESLLNHVVLVLWVLVFVVDFRVDSQCLLHQVQRLLGGIRPDGFQCLQEELWLLVVTVVAPLRKASVAHLLVELSDGNHLTHLDVKIHQELTETPVPVL